jgi:hypothetical protein
VTVDEITYHRTSTIKYARVSRSISTLTGYVRYMSQTAVFQVRLSNRKRRCTLLCMSTGLLRESSDVINLQAMGSRRKPECTPGNIPRVATLRLSFIRELSPIYRRRALDAWVTHCHRTDIAS